MDELLDQAEQIAATLTGNEDLPRVDKNLTQILECSNRLWSKTARISSQDADDVKASLLLGSRGIDIPELSERLNTLSAATILEPLDPVQDTDIESFLRNERENIILSVVDECNKRTYEDSRRRHWDSLLRQWDQEKRSILTTTLGTQDIMVDFTGHQSASTDPLSLPTGSTLGTMEIAFAKQVSLYNQYLVEGGLRPSLISMFRDACKSFNDRVLQDFWAMVEAVVSNVSIGSDDSILRRRLSPECQADLIFNAKNYLEKHYKTLLQTTVYGNLDQVRLGGLPGTINLVRSFLSMQTFSKMTLEDGLVQEVPVWPLIYSCFRAGDVAAALEVSQRASSTLTTSSSNTNEMKDYLEELFTAGQLSSESETKIRLQYLRTISRCCDPYKRALYSILGRCDVTEGHTEVCTKVDDYLWLKLSQLQLPTHQSSEGKNVSSDTLTLDQLQSMLLNEYGESHFEAASQPFLYCQVLLLSGQLEAAVEFMSRTKRLRFYGIHIALVLHDERLLLTPSSTQAQILSYESSDPPSLRRLNFSRLILMYTNHFQSTNTLEALDYLFFLKNTMMGDGEDMFSYCISNLAIETRSFDLILGVMDSNGCRRVGAIDRYCTKGDNTANLIIEHVAQDCEGKGLFEDAIRLYDLADQKDKVLLLLTKILVQFVSAKNEIGSSRTRLQQLALSVAQRYQAQSHVGSRDVLKSFYLLLDLLTFYDFYHDNQLDAALEVLTQLQLVPFDGESVEQKLAVFGDLSEDLKQCMPDLLVASMNILLAKSRKIKALNSQSPSLSSTYAGGDSASLRNQARAVTSFVGRLPYRMPGDTGARIAQIELMIS